MQDSILYLILVLMGIIIYLLISQRKNKLEPKDNSQDINSLKDSINSSFNTMTASFNSLSKDVTRDMTQTLTSVNQKVEAFNTQVKDLNESQRGINKILAGVKKFGTLAEFSLGSLLEDLLPASQYLSNVKMKEETSENVEFAIKLKEDVLVPVDSHFPVDKFKAIEDAFNSEDKKAAADARKNLAKAFRDKAKSVNDKYINPPKTTDFAIVYAPTESLFSELSSYQDPINKELLTQELMKKYKVVILGPNTLSAYLQSLHMGFQTLKVQKHATEIYDHLKTISTRFSTHFDNIYKLRKKLEEAMTVVDSFGKDARAISRSIEVIKNPSDDDDPDSPTPISSAKQSEKRKVS